MAMPEDWAERRKSTSKTIGAELLKGPQIRNDAVQWQTEAVSDRLHKYLCSGKVAMFAAVAEEAARGLSAFSVRLFGMGRC